ncbi:hypothetical protein AVEN_49288-1 [Araneus ventricosus]|uniref:Peptidase aspartic putative domain-containing protein n=1 Tax=Araneus ventricosus TaxID=182803 RepID=A0A4Y2HQ09_ARAVE|nr:hypothetical protein AVEN_36718-1 [Araneus ventricosus]GBM67501.1 hypothetical protein AVEN_49288-1 [Araneus ventricosus]
MDRAKAKRAIVRQLFTKLVTKIESTIELPINERFTKVNKVESLFDLKNQLIEKIDQLKKLDNEIEAIIDLNDLEGELIASDEYRKNGISCRTKIERCILLLEKELNVIPRNETRNNNDSNIPEPLERRVVNENNVIKLPRLNISIFSGNCSEWLNFWISFEVAIHKNDSLSKIEKFAYLKTYLRGTALAAVSGFALTDQNYYSSIALIKERFRRSDLVISCHMNKLLMIESVKSVSNVTALRKMYDELEIQVRSLESLGVAADTYSSLLCPIVLQKIPEEINLQYNRQRKLNELFYINDLLKFLRKEIECRETSLLLGNQRNYVLEASVRKPFNSSNYADTKLPYSPKRNLSTAATLIATTKRQNCIFCSEIHKDYECPLSSSERKGGSERESDCGEVHVNLLRVINEELKYDRVKDLSELEVIGLNPKKEIPHSDLEILEAFEQNVTYENNGYGTKLLWKDNHKGLNDNYEIARQRLFSLNKGFKQREENFYSKYKDINNSQLEDNMLKINCESKNDVSKGFMPHRGVVKELKETTKLRICYDASCKANNEMSLNNCLDCSPNLNPDLLKIILKFGFYPIEFCADIQGEFLKVEIVEEERKFLQTLWIEEGLTNLTLDDHAVRILRTQRVPLLYKMTFSALNELYANDLIRSDYSLEETAVISKEAASILSEASVNMRQWTMNSPSLFEMWRENDLECRQSSSNYDIPLKDLELIWGNKKDTLKVAFNLLQQLSDKIPTKGAALSACGVPCDPLDILTPFTVRIKLLIQKLWENGFTWDEPLPPDIEFKEWPHELTFVQDVVVPHLHFSVMKTELLEVDKSSAASHKVILFGR